MIKNRNKLISNGETENDRKARSLALDALEDALKASDPREIIKSKIMLEGENLLINGEIQHIASFKRILVVGAGKAVGNMAEELDRILGVHFFNPAPLMKLVEVIPIDTTDSKIVDNIISTLKTWNKIGMELSKLEKSTQPDIIFLQRVITLRLPALDAI